MSSADILTYRYNGKLVYVPVAPDYTVSPTLHNILPANDQPPWIAASTLTRARCVFAAQGAPRLVSLALHDNDNGRARTKIRRHQPAGVAQTHRTHVMLPNH